MADLDNSLDKVTASLESTRVSPSGVSFAGKSLKLDSESDAKVVTEEIDKCKDLEYLNLEGNTLGVEAAKSIAQSLKKHPEFKRALWKDLFTGRMKTEIPKALQLLGDGLVTARAKLVELDLSDNAFGPIGVEGLASLLRSSSCYALEELRLNNNGLGITGGKLLASALLDCYTSSKNEGKPLALRVFIAGRNRLENEGAIALAKVFKTIGTLEEIAMPQNGIYHKGMSALSEAFTYNKNLKILNLNDNTIGEVGAEAIAGALPRLEQLRQINFGDCLLKTSGAILLAEAIKGSHNLEELILECNEIKREGGLAIVDAVADKINLKSLILDGNHFGDKGKIELESKMKAIGKYHALGSLDENESEDSEEDDENDSEDVEEETEEEEDEEDEQTDKNASIVITSSGSKEKITLDEFWSSPSADNFIKLGNDRIKQISDKVKIDENNVDDFIKKLMKLSALSNNLRSDVANDAKICTTSLYRDVFTWSQQKNYTSIVNNTMLIGLGLIKGEDKTFKVTWNLDGCFQALKNIVNENFVPESTKNALKVFVQKDLDKNGDYLNVKKEILIALK